MASPNKQPISSPRIKIASNAREDSKTSMFAISLTAVIISGFALTGTIFLWTLKNGGMSYRNGYLSAFGLPPDAMPWSTDDLTYLGYFVQEDLLIKMLGLFVALILVIAAVLYLGNWIDHYLAKRLARKKGQIALKKKENFATPGVIFCCVAAIVVFSLMYLSVLPLALFAPARARGEKDARAAMMDIRAWKVNALEARELNFVEIARNNAPPVAGVVISCTEKFCGLYSSAGPVHTHVVPLTDIKAWSKIEWADVPVNERADSTHAADLSTSSGTEPAQGPR
jgi:hypothetical protein